MLMALLLPGLPAVTEAEQAWLLAMLVVCAASPAFALGVNAPRGSVWRAWPLLVGLMGGLGAVVPALVLLTAPGAAWLALGLQLAWTFVLAPIGALDFVVRAGLGLAGQRKTLRRRRAARWALDLLYVWPAWLASALYVGAAVNAGDWVSRGVCVFASLYVVTLTGFRPLRSYVPADEQPPAPAPWHWQEQGTRFAGWLALASGTFAVAAVAVVLSAWALLAALDPAGGGRWVSVAASCAWALALGLDWGERRSRAS